MTQDTRTRIIEKSIVHIAQNYSVSIEEIAEASGVGRATVYRHFKSKNGLIAQVNAFVGHKLYTTVTPILDDSLSAGQKITSFIERMVPLGGFLITSSYLSICFKNFPLAGKIRHDAHLLRVDHLCRELKQQGFISSQLPVPWIVTGLNVLIGQAWQQIQDGNIAPNNASELVLETFVSGWGHGIITY